MKAIWDYWCPRCDITVESWQERDDIVYCSSPQCIRISPLTQMKRCPGGNKMLYFEEGRPRTHWSMSDKPITSHSQHQKMMKEHGLAEAGNALPPRMKAKGITPKKEAMREIVAANKGRWI